MRIEIKDRPQRPVRDVSDTFDINGGGQFFSEFVTLPAGKYATRVQVIFSEWAKGEKLTIAVRAGAAGESLAEVELDANPERRESGDEIFISFELKQRGAVEIHGHVSANYNTTLFRYITILSVESDEWSREDFFAPHQTKADIKSLRAVGIGTTGVCNASCPHCPTNKPSRIMPPGRMSMELFTKIIRELSAGQFKGTIAFGLFAEPLDDSLLVDRLRLIKSELPEVRITVATNCGLFDAERHSEVIELVDAIGVHVESPIPEVYDRLMDPLKAAKVFPKIEALLRVAAGKKKASVHLTAPVHSENLFSISDLHNVFGSTRDFAIMPTGLSNRCWDEGPYRKLSLAPVAGVCSPPKLQREIFVDWDGAMLPCCFDFSKSMRLGNLSVQTINEVFEGAAWADMYETFRRGEWSRKTPCSKCRVDHAGTVSSMVRSIAAAFSPSGTRYDPTAFRLARGAQRRSDGSNFVGLDSQDGDVIYGPYRSAPRGRYTICHDLQLLPGSVLGGRLRIDVAKNMGQIIAYKDFIIDESLSVDCTLEFSCEGDEVLEFRVQKAGKIEFVQNGAILRQVW